MSVADAGAHDAGAIICVKKKNGDASMRKSAAAEVAQPCARARVRFAQREASSLCNLSSNSARSEVGNPFGSETE